MEIPLGVYHPDEGKIPEEQAILKKLYEEQCDSLVFVGGIEPLDNRLLRELNDGLAAESSYSIRALAKIEKPELQQQALDLLEIYSKAQPDERKKLVQSIIEVLDKA